MCGATHRQQKRQYIFNHLHLSSSNPSGSCRARGVKSCTLRRSPSRRTGGDLAAPPTAGQPPRPYSTHNQAHPSFCYIATAQVFPIFSGQMYDVPTSARCIVSPEPNALLASGCHSSGALPQPAVATAAAAAAAAAAGHATDIAGWLVENRPTEWARSGER